MSSNELYDIETAQKWSQWIFMTVNFYSKVKEGISFDWSSLFFFNDRLFPSLLKQKLNITVWANARSYSFEKPFPERSIPSKIKLTCVRSSTGTDSIWLALSNLILASMDWYFKWIACLMGPTMFTSDSSKSWAFWVLF